MCLYVSGGAVANYANLIHVKGMYGSGGVMGGCSWMSTPCIGVWVPEGMHVCTYVHVCEDVGVHIYLHNYMMCIHYVHLHACLWGVSGYVLVYM